MDPVFGKFLERIRNEYFVRPIRLDTPYQLYSIDLSRFRLRVSTVTPLLMCGIEQDLPSTLRAAASHLTGIPERSESIAIIVIDGHVGPLLADVTRIYPDWLVLGREDVVDLVQSESLEPKLVALLRSRLQPSVLSPYNTSSPARGSMLIGRSQELTQLLARKKTSFAIWGMRRIGKTSLLQEVHRSLVEDRGVSPKKVMYIDCEPYYSPYNLVYAITVDTIGPRQARELDISGLTPFLRSYSNGGRDPFVLLLDEIDNVVLDDITKHGRAFFKALRAAHNEGYCRLIFSGYRAARTDARRLESPFYNYAEEIELRGLNLNASRRLVKLPFEDLGIKVEDMVVDEIYTQTRGLPALIQHICSRLIQAAQEDSKAKLTQEDLSRVLSEREYSEKIMDVFLHNTIHLEKLIVYQQLSRTTFTEREVTSKLIAGIGLQIPMEDILSGLRYLVRIGVLGDNGGSFSFANPRLRDLLHEHNIPTLIERAIIDGRLKGEFV